MSEELFLQELLTCRTLFLFFLIKHECEGYCDIRSMTRGQYWILQPMQRWGEQKNNVWCVKVGKYWKVTFWNTFPFYLNILGKGGNNCSPSSDWLVLVRDIRFCFTTFFQQMILVSRCIKLCFFFLFSGWNAF